MSSNLFTYLLLSALVIASAPWPWDTPSKEVVEEEQDTFPDIYNHGDDDTPALYDARPKTALSFRAVETGTPFSVKSIYGSNIAMFDHRSGRLSMIKLNERQSLLDISFIVKEAEYIKNAQLEMRIGENEKPRTIGLKDLNSLCPKDRITHFCSRGRALTLNNIVLRKSDFPELQASTTEVVVTPLQLRLIALDFAAREIVLFNVMILVNIL